MGGHEHSAQVLAHDPSWPRAGFWLADNLVDREEWLSSDGSADVAVVGIPAHLTSLSPTRADTTPAAVRDALARFGTAVALGGDRADLRSLTAVDLGDVPDPDGADARVADVIARVGARSGLVVAIGGDNSITFPVARGLVGDQPGGLITLDAHHDLRDGVSNGSPVQRLIAAGLDGRRVVQIGISDFANSPYYAARAKDHGITVIRRDELEARPMADVVAQALDIAGAGGGPIHVDLDVDVCDRSVAPGCPASVPGGISAHQLRAAARLLAADARVCGIDITEVDAAADAPDGRTVRLAALLVLEAMAGSLARRAAH